MIQGRQAMSPSLLLAFLCGLIFIAGEAALIATESGGGDDKEVLLELKRFLIANNKVNRGGYEAWQESDPSPCLWRGVGCNRGGRVTSLNLTCSTMSGPAFGNFSRLSVLTSLDLSDNSIIGALPVSDLNQCHGLVHLNISHNLITGSLNVSGLTKLRVLDVSANRLEGGIAFNFPAICANLTLLHLSTNNITGNITNMLERVAPGWSMSTSARTTSTASSCPTSQDSGNSASLRTTSPGAFHGACFLMDASSSP